MTHANLKICILALLTIAVSSCNSRNPTETETVNKCYERITSGNGITDRLTLEVQFRSDSIYGKLNWIPQEKDSQRGTITGIRLDGSTYDVRYDYTGEGVSNTQKQSIVFENDRAIIIRKGDSNPIDTLRAVARE